MVLMLPVHIFGNVKKTREREMALHARFLTQNILRVSKFKKLTHTAQAIDRTCEKNGVGYCAQTANAVTKEEKSGEASTEVQLPPSPQWCLQPWSLDDLVPACLPLSMDKLSPLREHGLTAPALSQDCLPSVAKPVSYTTDDIMTCPLDRQHHIARQGIVYKNYPVTMLTEQRGGEALLKSSSTKDACSSSATEELSWDSEAHCSVLYCPSSFRRHSVCDSHSSDCRPHFSHGSSMPNSFHSEGLDGSLAVSATANSPAAAFSPNAVLHCAGMSAAPHSNGKGTERRGPNFDQLKAVESFFIETLPTFFKSKLDYRVYHPDVVFENNFWGENERTIGINQYAIQMTKLRALTHLRYAHVHMEVVSSACLLDEARVRVQWRIVGLSQFKALRFWKYTAWSYGKAFREDAEWIDGISNFHVSKDGLVTKHRLDRMTPSEEQLSKEPTVGAKLALLFGLGVPKPSWSDCASLLCRR